MISLKCVRQGNISKKKDFYAYAQEMLGKHIYIPNHGMNNNANYSDNCFDIQTY